LGNSGLKVSAIGLGGNNFGFRINEQDSVSIIHHALSLGINYIDTADWYSNRGLSEQFIGKAIKGKRSQVIIATKFGFPMGESPNDAGNSRYHILNAIDASLKRLDTDYIDLYQVHRPDPGTPIEETLWTLDKLVRDGKVRYIGCSNFPAWLLNEALWVSRTNSWAPIITIQSEYNLLDRQIEAEVIPCCNKHNIGIIPWGPLAGGLLSGKYVRSESAPTDSRVGMMSLYRSAFNLTNFDKLDKLKLLAEKCQQPLPGLAIGWLLAQPFISTVIAGATRIEQVTANVEAARCKLTPGEINAINQIVGEGKTDIAFGDKGQSKK
jgi:aryl-alcohol dehydrogenase-like predicted oxidoreductase